MKTRCKGWRVGMSTFRKRSMDLVRGWDREGPRAVQLRVWERPEWRPQVRDVLGLTENFLHREKLARLALSRIPVLRIPCEMLENSGTSEPDCPGSAGRPLESDLASLCLHFFSAKWR